MVRLPLSVCSAELGAQLTGDDVDISTVSIDTRKLAAGDVYVAIRGEQFDGHQFVNDAIAKGARAVVVDRSFDASTCAHSDTSVLQVSDTRRALGGIASLWAKGHQVPTIAVTGSNGKTSVKEMLASIFGQLGPTLSTVGNLNNDIGVPLTLLSLRPEHQYAIVEMGANHVGEIQQLTDMVQPDVAVVTNIGAAHIEGFGSVEDIANAKSEIYSGVCSGGFGVINADDRFASVLEEAADELSIRTFGFHEDADVRGIECSAEKSYGFGRSQLQLATLDQTWSTPFSLLGQHNVMNALAATAAAQCLDVQRDSILTGLATMQAVSGRLQTVIGLESSTIINDSYNANPASARAAIDVLACMSGERHFVLGNMAELGRDASVWHAQIGEYAKHQGIEHLWTTGDLAAHAARAFGNGKHFSTQAELVMAIETKLNDASIVLVKGSRSSQMEVVVRALTEPQMRDTSSVTIDLAEGMPS